MEEKIKKGKRGTPRDGQYFKDMAIELRNLLETLPRDDEKTATRRSLGIATRSELLELAKVVDKKHGFTSRSTEKAVDSFLKFFSVDNEFIEYIPATREETGGKGRGGHGYSFDIKRLDNNIVDYVNSRVGKKNRAAKKSKIVEVDVIKPAPSKTIAQKIKEDAIAAATKKFITREGLDEEAAQEKATKYVEEMEGKLSEKDIKNLHKILELQIKYGPVKCIPWSELKHLVNKNPDRFRKYMEQLFEKAQLFGIRIYTHFEKVQNYNRDKDVYEDVYDFAVWYGKDSGLDAKRALEIVDSYANLRNIKCGKRKERKKNKETQAAEPIIRKTPAIAKTKVLAAASEQESYQQKRLLEAVIGKPETPAVVPAKKVIEASPAIKRPSAEKVGSRYIMFVMAGMVIVNRGAAVDPGYVTSILKNNHFKPVEIDAMDLQDIVLDNPRFFRITNNGLIALVGNISDTWEKLKKFNPKNTSWNIPWIVNSGLTLREIQEHFPDSYRLWEEVKVGSAVYIIKADRSIRSMIELSKLQMRMRDCDFPAVEGGPGLVEKLKIGYKNLVEILDDTFTDRQRKSRTENDKILYQLENL